MPLSFRHVRTFVFAAVTALIAIPFVAVVKSAPTSAQDVRTNSMPGTDFAKFKTYR